MTTWVDPRRVGYCDHAIESYRKFYPYSETRDFRDAVANGIVVDRDLAVCLLGRHPVRSGNTDCYVLHPERTGLFVLVPSRSAHLDQFAITFLRFYAFAQYETATKLYPGGEPVTADATWNTPAVMEVSKEAVTSTSLAEVLVGEKIKWKTNQPPGGKGFAHDVLDQAALNGKTRQIDEQTWHFTMNDLSIVKVVKSVPEKIWLAYWIRD